MYIKNTKSPLRPELYFTNLKNGSLTACKYHLQKPETDLLPLPLM
jgi:hypothetical protein